MNRPPEGSSGEALPWQHLLTSSCQPDSSCTVSSHSRGAMTGTKLAVDLAECALLQAELVSLKSLISLQEILLDTLSSLLQEAVLQSAPPVQSAAPPPLPSAAPPPVQPASPPAAAPPAAAPPTIQPVQEAPPPPALQPVQEASPLGLQVKSAPPPAKSLAPRPAPPAKSSAPPVRRRPCLLCSRRRPSRLFLGLRCAALLGGGGVTVTLCPVSPFFTPGPSSSCI
ncbi:proline-rich protein 36-like [Nothobranchius furzeri]|uniref:Proline-rich protein 36-like n=1 Tax=Nothobranchius furzeri TaxID=105023 RepID=A0A9D2XX61_NOTFU|nr:proline-rich protein 36-like [Nothobranchius furzeri]